MEFHAFLSYAWVDDDEFSGGVIEELLGLIQSEGRQVTGQKNFTVFRDTRNIEVGEDLHEKIEVALNQSTILFPIITPAYFESQACLKELEIFLAKENELGRQDLVIPIYFTDAYDMRPDAALEARPTGVRRAAGTFQQRRYVDLRDFRRTGFRDKHGHLRDSVAKSITNIGIAIRTAFRTSRAETYSKNRENFTNTPFEPGNPSDLNSSLYKERLSHFQHEKEYLADKFGDYLINRLRNYCVNQNQNQNVLLFIDSGTTLFNFFIKLGYFAKHLRQVDFSWLNKFAIVTNNLEGVQWLMKNARMENERSSGLALQCAILPGIPSPVYSATIAPPPFSEFHSLLAPVSTPNTIKAIYGNVREKNKSAGKNDGVTTKVISLIAGNWVRIRETLPRLALPLSRGAGQLEIKQSLIDISDEVYLVSPLGKIFAEHSKEEVYGVLDEYISRSHPGNPPYEEVNYNIDDSSYDKGKIRLVTTYRGAGDVLANLSDLLAKEDFVDAQKISENSQQLLLSRAQAEFRSVPNLMFEYNLPAKDIPSQIQLEFPHGVSRNRKFVEMFHVDRTVLNYLT